MMMTTLAQSNLVERYMMDSMLENELRRRLDDGETITLKTGKQSHDKVSYSLKRSMAKKLKCDVELVYLSIFKDRNGKVIWCGEPAIVFSRGWYQSTKWTKTLSQMRRVFYFIVQYIYTLIYKCYSKIRSKLIWSNWNNNEKFYR